MKEKQVYGETGEESVVRYGEVIKFDRHAGHIGPRSMDKIVNTSERQEGLDFVPVSRLVAATAAAPGSNLASDAIRSETVICMLRAPREPLRG